MHLEYPPLLPQMGCHPAEIDGDPVDDGVDCEVQAGRSERLGQFAGLR